MHDVDPDIEALLTVALISLSFLIIVFSILGLYFYWYARLRLPPVQMVAPYIPNPPEKLSPGAAGLLLGEVPPDALVRAVLLDIAHRGGLTVQPDSSGNIHLTYKATLPDLTPMEQRLLASLGLNAPDATASLRPYMAEVEPDVIAGLEEELRRKGYLHGSISTAPSPYSRPEVQISIALCIVAIVVGVYLLQYTGAGFCLPLAFIVMLVGFLVLDRNRSAFSPAGAQARERWAAFRRYLTVLKSYTDTSQAHDLLDRYLPYAVAFGVEQRFLNEFDQGVIPAPTWWIPLDTGSHLPRTYRTGSGSSPSADLGGGTGWSPGSGNVRLPDVSIPTLSDASNRIFEGLGSAGNTTFSTLDAASRGLGKVFSSGGGSSSKGGSSSGKSSSSDNDGDGCLGGVFKAIGGAIAAVLTFLAQLLKAILNLIVTIVTTIWRALVAFWLVIWGNLVIFWDALIHYDPIAFLGLGAGIAVIGSGLVYWFWSLGGRAPKPITIDEAIKTPPDDLGPAGVALLLNQPPANRDWSLVFLWLDLARRGVVQLANAGGGLQVTRTNTQIALTPIEQLLLRDLGLEQNNATVVLGSTATSAEELAVRRLEQVLEHDGYLHTARARWYRLAGIAAIIVAVVTALITLGILRQPPVVFPFAGSIIAALLLIYLGRRTSGLLPGGALAIGRWQAFTQYLNQQAVNDKIRDEYWNFLFAAYPDLVSQMHPAWWTAGDLPRRSVPQRSDMTVARQDIIEALAVWWYSMPFMRRA